MNLGRVLNALLSQERIEKAKHERPQERYARIEIKLDDASYVGNDIELHLTGDYLGKIKYDGSATGCYLRLNNRHAGKIYAAEFRRTYAEYDRIYLSNPSSQSGKKLILVVGGAFAGEIEPSTGAKSGIIDSGGADVDPTNLANQALIVADADSIRQAVEELDDIVLDEDVAHATGDSGVQTLAVRKATPADLSGTDGDYEPLQVDEGRLWIRELVDGGGDLQNIKEELELIKTAAQIIDDWDESDKCKVTQSFTGTPYVKSVVSPDAASVAAFEASTKKVKSVVIKNTHATYEALIGTSGSQVFELDAGASLALDNVDMNLLFHRAATDTENPTLHLIGTEN